VQDVNYLKIAFSPIPTPSRKTEKFSSPKSLTKEEIFEEKFKPYYTQSLEQYL